MLRMINSMWRGFQDRLYGSRNPVGFARSIGVRVGNNVRFYGISRAMFGSEPWMIKIGNDVYITAGVTFITHDGGSLILRKEIADLEWSAPITIGNDVYIGVQSLIMPGVRIGNRCVIGARSVVTKDVQDNSVVVGAPARVICTTDQYLEKMQNKSLRLGHLHGAEKDAALRKILAEQGWFDEGQ
jgi:acetyltransferase-like isoleucine patch superfamily enzyme